MTDQMLSPIAPDQETRLYDKFSYLHQHFTQKLYATNMTEAELNQEIAVMLFQKKKLGLGKASEFVGTNIIMFQHLLADRQIPAYEYDIADYEPDCDGRIRIAK